MVKVIPASGQEVIVGLAGGVLKVKVCAPPEKGKANDAVKGLLARALGLSKSQVRIVSGHLSPIKRVHLDGMDATEALARLGLS
ncbi:MAG: DUF167 domain-containing protein [Sedimentisphaerales bacterium]|jgi:uncharacterized protein (TIGR00251 family)|nr:DUF167 domain-containing protein [Sedimentisphaerales bacterium]